MISKISPRRSNDPGGLVNYLFGPGHANEHVNQRTIAGSVHYPGLGTRAAVQVTADLRTPQRMWPAVTFPGGHVWHCSLALSAAEGQLPERKWASIADDFMRRMQFTGQGRAPLRWTAVHHGPSAAGNDHIHIVVNLVREDGTKVNIWQDMTRSQKVVHELEQAHGLQVLQSRTAGVGNVPYTVGEVARSRATSQPVERVELERIVRAAATASSVEAEFVGRLRTSGVVVRPFPPSGRVTGYSVGLPPPPGLPALFFQGGKLARDLTLPKLRATWPGSDELAAQAAWRRGAPASRAPVPNAGVPVSPDAVARALDDLEQLGRDLQSADPAQFGSLSRDLAGALSAAASAAHPDDQDVLRRAARDVGAWAGGRSYSLRPVRGGRSAALLFLLAAQPDSEWAKTYMIRQLTEAVLELHRLHRTLRSVVGPTLGRGVRMSTVQDDTDGVFNDAVMVGVTTTAAVVAHRAQKRREQIEVARQAGVEVTRTRFRDRFRLHRNLDEQAQWSPGLPGPDRASDVPKGLQGYYSADEWAALTDDQRRLVDPDKVGVWPTDYRSFTPGATMPATAEQIKRAGLIGDALNRSGKGAEVAALTREDAATILRTLEGDAGARLTRDTYFDAGLPYRSEHLVETSHEAFGSEYRIEFPPPPQPAVPATSAPDPNPQPTVTVAASEAPKATVSKLDDPTTWRTASAPMTAPMRQYLLGQGHIAAEIDQLDKAHASLVIHAHKTQGDEAGHDAMDQALAAMERLRQEQGSGRPKTQGPAPTPDRTR